ncbi:MAG: hypothetical protein JST16_17110 [Bdellovibrionales bacterium]|nr:hypothetical protein [Bdellovibrionales bacterium]
MNLTNASLHVSSLLIFVACASSSHRDEHKTVVTVDAVSAASLKAASQPVATTAATPKPTIKIMPWDDKSDANDLFFIKRKKVLENFLTGLGYRVQDSGKAQLNVKVAYGTQAISGAKHLRYKRWLDLKAVKEDRTVDWEVTSQSSGKWADLDRVLPYHLAAIKPYVGADVARKTVSLAEGADEVKPYLQEKPEGAPKASM